MEEVVQNIPQRFNKKYFEIQHYKAKSKIMENQVAVHEARRSEKVVKFINQDSLNEDIWGDVYENIFKAGK